LLEDNVKGRPALHVQIVQLAAEGKSNKEIAETLGVTARTVARWRMRFFTHGTAGVEKEKPRPGRPPAVSPDQVKQVLAKFGEKRWSTRMVARTTGVSATTIRRIWKSQAAPTPIDSE